MTGQSTKLDSYSRVHRAERLICTARAVLATFSLLAVWLDPSGPSRFVHLTYTVLTGYVMYSLLLLGVVLFRRTLPISWGLTSHLTDLTAIQVLMNLTEGPVSPFYVYFVFALLAAMLRWQEQGILYTALYTLISFTAMGVEAARAPTSTAFELNRFIIRAVYLAVAACMLAYVARYQGRIHRDLARLAAWPRSIHAQASSLVAEILREVAAISQANRVLVVWEEREEPWVYSALRSDGRDEARRDPPGTFGMVVAESLGSESFLCLDARSDGDPVLVRAGEGVKEWRGIPIDRTLAEKFGITSALSWPLQGENFNGRLFLLDQSSATMEDLVIGEIVARMAESHLEQFYLLEQLRAAAATQERNRLARDLHDSLLQSLSMVVREVGVVRHLVPPHATHAVKRLRDVAEILAGDLSELRSVICDLRPSRRRAPRRPFDLRARLVDLGRQMERQWGLRATLRLEGVPTDLHGPLPHEIYRIAQEALVNAARHAAASTVDLELGLVDGVAVIKVVDDGRGFPFKGKYDLAALNALEAGPATVKERVSELGGNLVITSSDFGSTLDITIPLPAES